MSTDLERAAAGMLRLLLAVQFSDGFRAGKQLKDKYSHLKFSISQPSRLYHSLDSQALESLLQEVGIVTNPDLIVELQKRLQPIVSCLNRMNGTINTNPIDLSFSQKTEKNKK